MLRELRDAIAAEGPGPVRTDVLARRLGTDPATVAAMIEHAQRRGLLPVAPERAACGPAACAPATRPACRHCPGARPEPDPHRAPDG